MGALLTGLIFDDAGNQMSPIRADKGARRYQYYVRKPQAEGAGSVLRLPAPEEKLVVDKTLEALEADVRTRAVAMKLARHGEITRRQFSRVMIQRVVVAPGLIRLHLDGASCQLFHQPGLVVIDDVLRPVPIAVEIPFDIRTLRDRFEPEGDLHPALIKALVRGYLWRTELMNETIKTVGRLIKKVRFRRDYILRILRLGFLAPDLIEAILNGRLPLVVTLEPLRHPIPLEWPEQREYFGLRAHQRNHTTGKAAAAKIIPFRHSASR